LIQKIRGNLKEREEANHGGERESWVYFKNHAEYVNSFT
jgi:hypothetical protein